MMSDQEIKEFVKKDETLEQELNKALNAVPGLKESCDLIPMTVYNYGQRILEALGVLMSVHVTQRLTDPGCTLEETMNASDTTAGYLLHWPLYSRLKAIHPKLNLYTHATIGPRLNLLRELITKDAPKFQDLKILDVGMNDDQTTFALTCNWEPANELGSTMTSAVAIKQFIGNHAVHADLVLVRGFFVSAFMMATGTRSSIKIVHLHEDAADDELNEDEFVEIFRHLIANTRRDAVYLLLDVFDMREIPEIVQEYWTRSNTTALPTTT